ncbi:class F sortase [Streptomyces sp. DT2A-34]|uniref:class F sortase n=1 Tax=Streptomyces sp. DT2A-34 TaxID=3051182 RepID=UPI00265BFF89|nr:class F sortase [Streptomyces sp. DT2A-34]MDO0914675.1 class F sortase [Streptomyces sp. DT2A-34]
MADHERPAYGGRLLMGVAWVVLLLGLWLWGREAGDVQQGLSAPVSGDVAAVGRPPQVELPPAARPLGAALPQRLDLPGLDVRAPVVARGLDRQGAVDPPPYDQADVVGWYAAGVKPGAAGAALMVGYAGTDTRPAVFRRIGALKPGATVRVLRDDGRLAEFTVDDVQVVARDRFDARQAYGAHRSGRAELRLITCGGPFDRATRGCSANVIVSAYLTGTGL